MEALKVYGRPVNKKDVQRLNGFINWLRKYIPKCGEWIAPITELLSDDVEFEWGERQEEALSTLIEYICKGPVLAIFDPKKPREIHTDASSIGIAGVLIQENRPVAFYSRKLTKAERRLGPTELELLALVETLQFFRCQCLGYNTKCVTDHNALRWLHQFHESKAKLYRWSQIISMFDIEIIHRPGTQMKHVDALSRSFCFTMWTLLQRQQIVAFNINGQPVNHNKKIATPTADEIKQLLEQHHDNTGHPGSNATLKN
ncbi:hypothetical protein B4U80_03266, partial [Leptotrombidium deliense]